MQRSRVDPCIYFGDGLIVFVYVDDIIISGASDAVVEDISNKFKMRFKMKDLGKPRRILGLDLIEVSEGIMLCGTSMIDDMLSSFDMSGSRHVSSPMDPNQSFQPNTESMSDDKIRLNYASAIGSLLYIGNTFRPDITESIHWKSIFRSLERS